MLTVKNSQTKNIILLCSHLLCCKTSQQLYILVTDLHPLLHFGMIQIAKKSKQLQVSNSIKIRAEKYLKINCAFKRKARGVSTIICCRITHGVWLKLSYLILILLVLLRLTQLLYIVTSRMSRYQLRQFQKNSNP